MHRWLVRFKRWPERCLRQLGGKGVEDVMLRTQKPPRLQPGDNGVLAEVDCDARRFSLIEPAVTLPTLV